MKLVRPGAFAAIAVALALTLSACGSDSEESMETATEETSVGTIVEVAIGAGNFSTLVAAVTAADLVETLSGAGPFTVFAPTDEAFAALPAGVLDALLLPENKATLAKIPNTHPFLCWKKRASSGLLPPNRTEPEAACADPPLNSPNCTAAFSQAVPPPPQDPLCSTPILYRNSLTDGARGNSTPPFAILSTLASA